jgi:two-component system nitrate/nitrite response regulator NarL
MRALAELTVRERMILHYASRGLSNAQIAQAVDLSQSAVSHEMAHIVKVLGVINRAEAASIAADLALGDVG